MSVRQFEEFIAAYFLDWARENARDGFRYQFRSPNIENSLKLFSALTDSKTVSGIISCKGSELPYIDCNGTKLLPVIHSDGGDAGFTENFISFLRDEVAGQARDFNSTALLIIHNSLLDTIVNSAEDLSNSTSVFNPCEIKKALDTLVETEGEEETKSISKILLKYQFDFITDDQGSMFGFEGLYTAISDGKMDFQEIGLLPDPGIDGMDGTSESGEKQIRRRLDRNRALYEEIEDVLEHFPDQLETRLPDLGFSDGFIKKHFSDPERVGWKDVSYPDYFKEQEENKEQKLKITDEHSVTGAILVRTKGTSKSAQKTRHVLIEVAGDRDDFDLEVSFTGSKIRKEELSVRDRSEVDPITKSNLDLQGGAKNTTLTVTGAMSEVPRFFSIRLKRNKASENFTFNCLVVKEGLFNCEAIKNIFLIIPHKKLVGLQTQDTTLEISNTGLGKTISVKEANQVFDSSSQDILDFTDLSNEVDRINFYVKSGTSQLEFDIEGAAATASLHLPLLLDSGNGYNLFKEESFGVFNQTKNRVYINNKEVKGTPRSTILLNYEQNIVDKNLLSFNQDADKQVTIADIKEIAPALSTAYSNLYIYYRENKTLPSLAAWDAEYQNLVQAVVVEYHSYLSDIPLKQYLGDSDRLIVMSGVSVFEGREFFTPFHPLVLAYYDKLVMSAVEDESDGFYDLPKVTLDRLNPQGLIPFIFDSDNEFSYVKAEEENCFWMHCVPHRDTNYSYVTKLVRDKIEEFTRAFEVLFVETAPHNSRPTLIINSVNNFANEELFNGIVTHVIRRGSKTFNIHVNLYDDELVESEFDKFVEISNYDQIKARYKLNIGAAKNDSDTIVDMLRTRVTYSKFTHEDVISQAYAHLTFFRNNQKVKVVSVNPSEKLSGVSCHGLINGEASASDKNNYITGFGLNEVDYEGEIHLEIAEMLGRLIRPVRETTSEYRDNSAIALAVDDQFKALLERSYDSSIWTTVIDPKVTLDFFENSENMLLIHYSDQYTSSASYDAITVTRQTDLYDKVLAKDDGGLIGEFNAFNGEWLLQMVSAPPKIRKERKGILAAYKLVSCLLSKSDITWVPMSVGEMVRVAGNIGLSKAGSEFSRHVQKYYKGPISDDVLFAGVKDEKLYLLPLEVKSGVNYNPGKAIEQARELGRYLAQDVLAGAGLDRMLYRGLFVRQMLMQIDKYHLYSIYPDNYFDHFLDKKEWWLKGDYQLAAIDNYPDGFVVANLENDSCLETTTEEVGGILKIEVPFSFVPKTISTPLKSLMLDSSQTAVSTIADRYFLEDSEPKKIVFGEKVIFEEAEIADETIEISSSKVKHDDVAIIEAEELVNRVESVIPAANSKNGDTLKILIGNEVKHGEDIYWEPTNTAKFMNTNSGIIGTMGTGKTQCTKSVVTQLYRNQHLNVDAKPIGILIFDYKSDYVDDKFMGATAAEKYNLHKLPYNPLSLFGDTPMLPVHTARGFSETMGKAFGLGQKQLLRLRKLIAECYELAGISKSDASTWIKPAPTIADVWSLFISQEKVEEDSLYAALESLNELEIFENDITKCTSLYELVSGITVVELAGYPPQIQNLVVALTLDLFYSQMQKQGKPEVQGDFRQITKLILVDEADNFMSQDFPSLRKVLKEGREYGVGVILSTQDITHFKTKENDYSAYILSWVIHRVSQIKNQDIKALLNKDDRSEQESLMKTIRGLDKHYSLYVDGDKKLSKIKDKAFWELMA